MKNFKGTGGPRFSDAKTPMPVCNCSLTPRRHSLFWMRSLFIYCVMCVCFGTKTVGVLASGRKETIKNGWRLGVKNT
jgi:hypothetical protein